MTLDELRERLRESLTGRGRHHSRPPELIPAAVLVLVVERNGALFLVFTKRTEHVAHHKGQFSFPGGIIEPEDLSEEAAALREANEEVGLNPQDVEVIGLLDDLPGRAAPFVITPVLALARRPMAFTPDPEEVERILEVPLAFLSNPANCRVEIWERDGESYPIHFFEYEGDVIWGVTGRILKHFLELIPPSEERS